MAREPVNPRVRRRASTARSGTPLETIRPGNDICLELRDHTRVTKSAVAFFGTKASADPAAQAARLADQFIRQNVALFQLLQVSIQRDYDGRDVLLHIDSGSAMRSVARQMGGTLKAGRRRETVSPLAWDPPYTGSQRSLVPDMILELDGRSFIMDAKYKRHWEELQQGGWQEHSTEWQEGHREDLLQVLAYANLVSGDDIVCCLVYPCSQGTWESLAKRGRLFHQAELPNRGRRVRVWLTGVPMGASAESVAGPFGKQIRIAGS
jgi:hypothetical protein